MFKHDDVRSFVADGAITARRIVKWGSADSKAAQASAATDSILGVCCSPSGAADTERVDIVRAGYAEIEYGGNVTRGDALTTDANGKAIAVTRHTHVENTAGAYAQNATTGAAAIVRIIGFAEVSGVLGDIGEVRLAPGLA